VDESAITLRFESMSLADLDDEEAFKQKVKDSLITIGNKNNTLDQCRVHLREGSIIAEVRGPVVAVAEIRLSNLTNVTVDGVHVSSVNLYPYPLPPPTLPPASVSMAVLVVLGVCGLAVLPTLLFGVGLLLWKRRMERSPPQRRYYGESPASKHTDEESVGHHSPLQKVVGFAPITRLTTAPREYTDTLERMGTLERLSNIGLCSPAFLNTACSRVRAHVPPE